MSKHYPVTLTVANWKQPYMINLVHVYAQGKACKPKIYVCIRM